MNLGQGIKNFPDKWLAWLAIIGAIAAAFLLHERYL